MEEGSKGSGTALNSSEHVFCLAPPGSAAVVEVFALLQIVIRLTSKASQAKPNQAKPNRTKSCQATLAARCSVLCEECGSSH